MDQNPYSGYKILRKASRSLRSMLLSDMMGRASWSRMPSWSNRAAKQTESREKKIGGHDKVFHQPAYNLTNESDVHTTFLAKPTHQKSNVSIFEEVFVMSCERIISCISRLVGAG